MPTIRGGRPLLLTSHEGEKDEEECLVYHEPVVHPDNPYSSNTWGILPPRSYFKFDEASVEAERNQEHAYYTRR